MHTYHGPNGMIIHYNGDFSGMAILCYQGAEVEVPASEIAPHFEQERIVREIAFRDPEYDTGEGYTICHYCDGPMKSRGKAYSKEQVFFIEHESDCLWVRSRAIVEQLDGGPG